MTDLKSPILSLPYIAAAQAQKHVTHNEALAVLDVAVQLAVLAFDVITPPSTPEEGDVYGIGAGASGVWAGQETGTIAAYLHGAWAFVTPQDGWLATEAGTGAIRAYKGAFPAGAWAPAVAGVPETLTRLGVNTSADDVNRLSVNADATLLNHGGAGHQLKLNKSADSDTASLLFQTGFSGRAEMGTAGSDDFVVKVSADGNAWRSAIEVDAATGAARFPSGALVPLRLPVVGRWACEMDNSWAGFNENYGAANGNNNSAAGLDPEPAVHWSNMGLPVAEGTQLHELRGRWRVDATQVVALDIRIAVQYGLPDGTLSQESDVTRDVLWSVDGLPMAGTGFSPFTAPLGGYTVPQDASLLIFVRPVGTLTKRRDSYLSSTLHVVMPA
ncbi:MAG: DUF2793 domain-containing protein [Pseudomonadota bacterium]